MAKTNTKTKKKQEMWFVTIGRSTRVRKVIVREVTSSTMLLEEFDENEHLDLDTFGQFGIILPEEKLGARTRYLTESVNIIERAQ